MKPLRVLLVEDSENDSILLRLELERAGYQPVCHRVQDAETMREALERQSWDLVIADYVMPRFNGLAALALTKEFGLDLPFIVVSGHIAEDTAVAAMKAGAHDYVMKDNLARLGPAVTRELGEAEVRRERRRSEDRLKAESSFRQAIENSVPSGITVVDLDGRQTYVNPAFCSMVGWMESELVGAHPPFLYWPENQREVITGALARVVSEGSPASGLELRFQRRSGELLDVLLQITPLKDLFGNVSGWVSSVSNISERKRAEVRLAAEHAITRILTNANSLEEAAPGIVQVLLDALEMDVGTLWVVNGKQSRLEPMVTKLRQPSTRLTEFLEEQQKQSLPIGAGIPGKVWTEGRALWISELKEELQSVKLDLGVKAGLLSGIAFPIQSGGTPVGVIEFLSIRRLNHDETLVNMMTAIGSEIGQFIQRRTAEDALRRANDELEIRVQKRTLDLKLANAKLHSSIAQRKRLEHELLEITEKERRRIGLDLHDDLGQRLSGVALMTKGLEIKLEREKNCLAKDAANVHQLVQEAMNHASGLARDLTTLDLKGSDLSDALGSLALQAKDLFDIVCIFTSEDVVPALEPSVVGQVYKIAQEAVTNAIKHGKAKKVGIQLAAKPEGVVLTVENNGRPFPDLNSQATGMGLKIMNYRASLIGASLQVTSLGSKGTRVVCTIPADGKNPS
jgi:PAS domain S-box-containing protein